ncbi:MAG TPA: RHS repeat-associated core domain-containing protein [Thermoanaerobaculia bacterium]|jgi:RHS repeat-associated protein
MKRSLLFILLLLAASGAHAADGYFAVPPCRLLDTRLAADGPVLTANQQRFVQVAGKCNVPPDATAVSMNVVVVSPTSFGHFIIAPGNVAPAGTSALNFSANQNRANHAIWKLGNGGINLYPAGVSYTAHVVIDVDGYFSPSMTPISTPAVGPLDYQAVRECRVRDTRLGDAPIVNNEFRAMDVKGVCGIPDLATSMAARLHAVNPTSFGHMRLYSSDEPAPPIVSALNIPNEGVNAVTTNGAVVKLGTSPGDVTATYFGYNANVTAQTHAVLDVSGYFRRSAPAPGLRFVPLNPCRAVDTRNGTPLGSSAVSYQLGGQCGVPSGAKAVSANFTVLAPNGQGHLVAHAAGEPEPLFSTMSFSYNDPAVASSAIVRMNDDRIEIIPRIFAGSTPQAHLLIDISGYWVEGCDPAMTFCQEAATSAQVHPNTARGGVANTPFHNADVDRVNLFNGNLNINLPLGITYPVGPSLSYGFSLAYNSNMWRSAESDGAPEPDQQFNAGLGWQVTHGRLYAPFSRPPGDTRWVYVGMDGSEHVFFERLRHADAEDPGDDPLNPQFQTWYYTRDGSYLRLTHRTTHSAGQFPSNAAIRSRLELPNGEIHYFDGQGRPVEIRDRFGTTESPDNWIRFSYANDRVTITDSWSRTHTIHTAIRSNAQTVSRVEMAAVNGATNVVTFTYADHAVWRPCQTQGDLQITVPLLQSVHFSPDNDPSTPNEWSYQMEDYVSTTDIGTSGDNCRSAGALEQLRLPTGGKLRWTYRNVSFPQASTTRRFFQRANGVATRATLMANNAVIGTWSYLMSGATSGDFSESVTTLTDPLGVVSKSYFSVYASSGAHAEGFKGSEYGLPLTHRASRLDPTDAPGLFLSAEIFEPGSATPVRSTWVRYEQDAGVGTSFDTMTNVNSRMAEDRIVYEDDCETGSGPACTHRFKSTLRTGWDNLGHYRTTTLGGNFQAANFQRTETTYNPSGVRPAVSAPWILETYNAASVDAGSGNVTYTSFNFDGSTGALSSKRVHYLGNSTSNARDVVTTFTRGAGHRGFVTSETASGSDTGGSFVKNYTISCGALATSRVQGASHPDVDRTIDCSTGLIASERDRIGLTTSYSYDLTGRRTLLRPPGEADHITTFTYLSNGLRVTTSRRSGGVDLQKTELEYDELGRARSQTRFRTEYNSAGSLITKRDVQKQTYDAAGHLATQSTVVDSSLSANPPTVKYQQFDAFGRTRRIVNPDGAIITVAYTGEFSKSETTKVGRSFSSTGVLQQDTAQKTQRYDRMGRLWKIIEEGEDAPDNSGSVRCGTPTGVSSSPFDCYTDTIYTYDEGGRLARVSQQNDRGTQTREFRHDPRGFLEAEIHPELDFIAGNTIDVQYGNYNALGMAGFRRDATNRLDYRYDAFARMEQVDETIGGTSRALKKYRFGTGNADRSNGRVVEATRFNYRNVGGTDQVIGITETIQYMGVSGRVSSHTLRSAQALGATDSVLNGVTGNESFTTGFTYDNLGLMTRIDYPQCNFGQAQCNASIAAARAVSFQYRDGLLVNIPGFTGQTVPGIAGSGITYHANGLWNRVAHANGAVYTQHNDPQGMPRPQSYELVRPSVTNTIGPYVYDDSGNVVKIGNEKHLYDLTSRVWKSQMGDGIYGQEFRYDGFGNILNIESGVQANDRATPTAAATNRLTGATYDSTGRMTSWNGRTYAYDAAGDLASESIPATASWAAETWYYMYTVDGERVWSFSQAINGRPRRDRWTLRGLGNEILREYYAENYAGWGNAKDYIWRDGRHLLATVSPADGTRHFFADHLRSTRLILDAAGNNVPYMYSFLPFGEQFGTPGPAAEPTSRNERHRFAGHERDLHDPSNFADDLDYMHARHYNPLLGRFTSVDRGAPSLSIPQSWNRYAYALNRPTVLRDPNGRASGINYDELAQQIGPLAGWVWFNVDGPVAVAEKSVVIGSVAVISFVSGVGVDVFLTVTGVRFTGDVEQDLQRQAASAMTEWGIPYNSGSRVFPMTAIVTSWIPKAAGLLGLDLRAETSYDLTKSQQSMIDFEKWEVSFVPILSIHDEITVTTTWEKLPYLPTNFPTQYVDLSLLQ